MINKLTYGCADSMYLAVATITFPVLLIAAIYPPIRWTSVLFVFYTLLISAVRAGKESLKQRWKNMVAVVFIWLISLKIQQYWQNLRVKLPRKKVIRWRVNICWGAVSVFNWLLGHRLHWQCFSASALIEDNQQSYLWISHFEENFIIKMRFMGICC